MVKGGYLVEWVEGGYSVSGRGGGFLVGWVEGELLTEW